MANGKVPTERTVKEAVLRYQGIVEQLKPKNPPPEVALGDVVEIRASKHSPLYQFNHMWGTIEHVGSFSYTVRVSIALDTQQCKDSEMVKIDDEYTADIKVVSQRIAALVQFELEPIEYDLIALLTALEVLYTNSITIAGMVRTKAPGWLLNLLLVSQIILLH